MQYNNLLLHLNNSMNELSGSIAIDQCWSNRAWKLLTVSSRIPYHRRTCCQILYCAVYFHIISASGACIFFLFGCRMSLENVKKFEGRTSSPRPPTNSSNHSRAAYIQTSEHYLDLHTLYPLRFGSREVSRGRNDESLSTPWSS